MATATPTPRIRGTLVAQRATKVSLRGDSRRLFKKSAGSLRLRGTKLRSKRG